MCRNFSEEATWEAQGVDWSTSYDVNPSTKGKVGELLVTAILPGGLQEVINEIDIEEK